MFHGLYLEAVTIGEDISGLPSFCIPIHDCGIAFGYCLHMAIAVNWIELLKRSDEVWNLGDTVFAC